MRILTRILLFCNRRWVKWTLAVVLVLAVTIAHFVMYGKYGGTEKSPAWEFTLALHSALLAAILIIVIYKKYIKRKLLEHYGTND